MDNTALRHAIRQRRKRLSTNERRHLAFLASLHLPKLLPLLPTGAKIGLYLDAFGELPTAPLLTFFQKYSFTPYLPITRPNQPLLFTPCLYDLKKTPLKRHKLGMKEPLLKNAMTADKLDCIICPLMAVDKRGNRLGMGGGFYDRTFATVPNVLKVGWCYDFQRVERLTVNAWDKGIDLLISDGGVWRFG